MNYTKMLHCVTLLTRRKVKVQEHQLPGMNVIFADK